MKLGLSTTMLPVMLAALLVAQGCSNKDSSAPAPAASAPPPAAAPAEAPAEAAPAAGQAEGAAPAEAAGETAAAPAEAAPAAEAPAAAPAPAVAANLDAGKKIFTAYCVTCHGVKGKGDGPAAGGLNPKPADFADGKFKYDTNGNGKPGDVEDIMAIAHDGAAKHGGSPLMTPWPMIKPDDLRAVAEYIKSLQGA